MVTTLDKVVSHRRNTKYIIKEKELCDQESGHLVYDCMKRVSQD